MNVPDRRTPEETRALILETAWQLFRQLGARTTIADVAERLGMSSANVYRFYASKQALSEAVCANQLDHLTQMAQSLAAGPGRPSERIRAVLLALHTAMRAQMTAEQRVHEIVDMAMSERWPSIAAYEEAIAAVLGALVAEGQERGEFGPGDPAELGWLTLCSCAGIHHPHMIALYADEPPGPEQIVSFAMRALSNPLPLDPPGA